MTVAPITAVRAGTGPARDARIDQILFLGSFLAVGVLARDFALAWPQVVLTFASAIATQHTWLAWLARTGRGPGHRPRERAANRIGHWRAHLAGLFGPTMLSAVVSSFGISLLVRADNLWVHPLLAALAMSSKFLVRSNGRHLFNPANLAAALAAFVLPGAWVSPGQWGQHLLLAAWIVLLGTRVTQRARRLEIGWVFLAAWFTLLAIRVGLLGQPPGVLVHQLHNGALLLFAFFMISDPMTTPRDPRTRIVFACVVALLAFTWQFGLGRPHGLLVALLVATPWVPWIDRRRPGPVFEWRPGRTPGVRADA